LRALGLRTDDAATVLAHLRAADAAGKPSHGTARIDWLETLTFDADARPVRRAAEPSFELWDGAGALGYVTLEAVVRATLDAPPANARLVVVERCFPTGALGLWARRLAEGGLVAVLTATSPRRLPHPDGGPPLTGTNPIAIAVPASDGHHLVADVSMGAVTHGDVLAGRAQPEELVPFGGPHAYKAFALAAGLEMLVAALAGPAHGAVLLVARPEHDPVPAFRELAAGRRLPGDSSGRSRDSSSR
jgi:(2R)-3-sulfolactate dehydrogenase (NADP+)